MKFPGESLKLRGIIFAVLLAAAMAGCAHLKASPPQVYDTPQTESLIASLQGLNAELKTYKGVGKIHMESGGVSQKFRAAWICRSPDRMRMDLLNTVPGIPMTKFSTDGVRLYFLTASNGQSRRRSTRNTSLEPLISVDADAREVVWLLCGRIPFRPFKSAETSKDPRGLYHILTLRDEQGRTVQKIYLTRDTMTPFESEFFDKKGRRAYRATMSHHQTVRQFKIPFTFVFSDDDGDRFNIEIERLWPAVAASEAVFTLNPAP